MSQLAALVRVSVRPMTTLRLSLLLCGLLAAVGTEARELTDMAGRVVTAGLSPEAALKEAHGRIEEIYKARRA